MKIRCAFNQSKPLFLVLLKGMVGWKWEEEELCSSLVKRLKKGEALDTRTFLRPVFKWIKQGLRKVGPQALDAIEKTFAYIEWMVQLSTNGDKECSIDPLPNIQPSYALNTVLTSSQRAGQVKVALRAFEMLVAYGYEPDVFAYTALIDVTARTGDVEAAIARYEEMQHSNSRPNIVTYTTILRAIGYSTKIDPELCLKILSHAREDKIIDDALYLEAVRVCVIHQHKPTITCLLEEIQQYDARLLEYPILLSQVETFVRDSEDKSALVAMWKEKQLFSNAFVQKLENTLEAPSMPQLGDTTINTTDKEPISASITKVHGCLGFETTPSVRHAVVQHDLTRLVERIHRGNSISHHDFETLIHQCRKRKWCDAIQQIVEAMNDIVTKGWYLEQFDVQIPPQPHIAPTRKTFLAVMDAYLCCEDEEMAWKYFIHPLSHGQKRDQLFYRKYIRGCYLLKACGHVEELLKLVQEQDVNVRFSQRMCVELIRIHGTAHAIGLKVLAQLVEMDAGASLKLEQLLLEELIKSCAYENNAQGVMDVYKYAVIVLGTTSFQMEMAVFVTCVHADSLEEALVRLRNFQDQRFLPKLFVYDSLLREIYFKYLSFCVNGDKQKKKNQKSKKKICGNAIEPSMSSNTISRDIVFKVLHLRRMLFEKINQDKAQLLSALAMDGAKFLAFYCSNQVSSLESAPLMFVQHAVEMITTLRDREAKLQTQEQLRDALICCEDPLLFVLRTVHSLQYLDLSPRSQGKLAKEILALLTTRPHPVSDHHVRYCINTLENLHVHVVKEIDEVVHLYKSHAREIVAYCTRVISPDNLDKTLSFLLSREKFYTLQVTSCTISYSTDSISYSVCSTTSCCLVTRLAELLVFHGLNAVLQYFKHEIGQDYVTMRRRFLRKVWLLENGIEDDKKEEVSLVLKKSLKAFPKAISELKMEHEEEFLPLLLQIHQQNLHASDSISHGDQVNQGADFFLTLSLSEDKILFVDDEEKLLVAYDVLLGNTDNEEAMIKRIALDVEWRPESRTGGLTSKCSIVQLACDTHVFIFDVLHLMQEFEELFINLLGSNEIEKIGYGIHGDFKKLRESFPDVMCFENIRNVRDFSIEQENKIKGGLSGYAQHYLGLPLCKYQQKSDWEARPLSRQQLQYAALDAYVLLQIHDKINQTQE